VLFLLNVTALCLYCCTNLYDSSCPHTAAFVLQFCARCACDSGVPCFCGSSAMAIRWRLTSNTGRCPVSHVNTNFWVATVCCMAARRKPYASICAAAPAACAR